MRGEDLLQFAWKAGIPGMLEFRSICGKNISIISRGTFNTDSGPDFTNARIGMDGIQLAGNIEMHVRSSDWFRHKHQWDQAYRNVILHVVYEHDIPVGDERMHRLPLTVCIGPLLPGSLLYTYRKLMESERFIPCSGLWLPEHNEQQTIFLERLMIERLERKVKEVQRLLEYAGGDWERVFLVLTGRYLQGPANAEPGERLAWQLPHLAMIRQRENPRILVALLLGMAGLLEEHLGLEQLGALQTEFRFQQRLLNLQPVLQKKDWKLSRMRPQGFPQVRLLQWAALMQQEDWRFGRLLDDPFTGWNGLMRCMNTLKGTEEFYHTMQNRLGADKILSIAINVLAPMFFAYGVLRDREAYGEQILEFIQQLSPEENKVSRSWQKLGLRARHAGESQALLELHGQYCVRKRCLECRVGRSLMLRESDQGFT